MISFNKVHPKATALSCWIDVSYKSISDNEIFHPLFTILLTYFPGPFMIKNRNRKAAKNESRICEMLHCRAE